MNRKRLQALAQPTGQKLAFYAGIATPGLHMKPSFLICGAQRCGTTSMYQALRTHPAIMRPTLRKGVHYFDIAYDKSPNWYQAHFPFTAHANIRDRATKRKNITFESSPYYLFHPLSAGRIASDLPDVKVIILVRDPVERAYSAHAHEFARGYETLEFEQALERENDRLAGEEEKLIAMPNYRSHAHQHQSYVHRGYFAHQVRRMMDAVGPDRVHVVDAEDFFAEPEPVWRTVTEFLGVGYAEPPAFARYNQRPRAPMAASVRASLREGYLASDEDLTSLLRKIPSWRRAE